MGQSNIKLNNIADITQKVAKEIDAEFYRLKHAYNALMLFEFFVEILKIRGNSIKHDAFDGEDYETIKSYIVEQLEAIGDPFSEEQIVKEAFYLGQICSTLTHGNLPLPDAFQLFGKVELAEDELS